MKNSKGNKRLCISVIFLLALLLTVGCNKSEGVFPEEVEPSSGSTAPESALNETEKVEDGPLIGCSLEDLGYMVERRENFGILYPLDVAHAMNNEPSSAGYWANTGGQKGYYFGPIKGKFTKIMGLAPFINGALSVEFMYLQAFEKKDLYRKETSIIIGEQTYTPNDLADFLVFEDEDIVVFDLFSLATQMSFSESLDLFVREEYNLEKFEPGYDRSQKPPELSPGMDYRDYTFLQDVYDYVKESLPELIQKETSPVPSE